MSEQKDKKSLSGLIRRAIGRENLTFDFDRWKKEHQKEIQRFKSQLEDHKIRACTRVQLFRAIIRSKITRFAAAAVLLIVVGYFFGRFSASRSLDAEQLHALETSLKSSLGPAIRQQLLEDFDRRLQPALASNYIQLKDELNQQFQHELNEFAVQTLAASSTVTNQLLTELIQAINTAQMQERRWVATALEQIELNRLQDNTQLRNDLAGFAVQTTDELHRTKQDVAKWIAYSHPDSFVPYEPENLTPSNERSKK